MATVSKQNHRRASNRSGHRAEEVAQWYFRLNGFFSIPGFVLHSGNPVRPVITDADLLAVRFPYSREEIRDVWMNDDRWVQDIAATGKTLFVIAEVKVAHCSVNGPWTDRAEQGMERVIRRFGFLEDEDEVREAANAMYNRLRCESSKSVLQYVCVGSRVESQVAQRFPDLVQINWNGVADFLYERFKAFGNLKGSHPQWGKFGREYSRAIVRGEIQNTQDSRSAVQDYLDHGKVEISEAK